MNLKEEKKRIIKEIYKPILKENGFRTTGNHFWKHEKEFIKTFNIQFSSFNYEQNMSFYINIGLLFPVINELNNVETPEKPKEYNCNIRFRSNSLNGNSKMKHTINRETDINEFEKYLKKELNEYIIPFYNSLTEVENCLEIKNKVLINYVSNIEYYVGLTLIRYGRFESGDIIFRKYLEKVAPENIEKLNRLKQMARDLKSKKTKGNTA